MNSNVAVAVISLTCLVAFFHPCNGIICYKCNSRNYSNPKCEKISGVDLAHDYGDAANYCMNIVFHKKPDVDVMEERLLVRRGVPNIDYLKVRNVLAEHGRRGFEVNYSKCDEDRCNSD